MLREWFDESSNTFHHPSVGGEYIGEKNATLFWRGATSEGYSTGGTWKGMTRQRLVWLTNSTHPINSNALVVPNGPGRDGHTVIDSTLKHDDMVSTDVRIVRPVTRCGGPDCAEQERAFGLVEPMDFQDHWKYKYLFDLDGAGFSGRFIPFLLSRSLPLKTALFREWYDSRLTPWLHFVPQDIRLHGVYGTLAYFTGLSARIDRSEVRMEPHDKEAEKIAEEGRNWASKVLRKEDMEIYMFRLLLEWGRLTDDHRNEIGFVL